MTLSACGSCCCLAVTEVSLGVTSRAAAQTSTAAASSQFKACMNDQLHKTVVVQVSCWRIELHMRLLESSRRVALLMP